MATSQGGQDITLRAAADSSDNQYAVMYVSAARTFTLATDPLSFSPCGILQNDPDTAGDGGVIRIDGTSKIILGGTLSAGATVTFNASGCATAVTSDLQHRLGILTEGGDVDEIGEVLLAGMGYRGEDPSV